MKVAIEIGVPDLDLECAVAQRVGALEEFDEVFVVEVEIQARGIGPHLVPSRPEQTVQR